jgi:hypothetical protein
MDPSAADPQSYEANQLAKKEALIAELVAAVKQAVKAGIDSAECNAIKGQVLLKLVALAPPELRGLGMAFFNLHVAGEVSVRETVVFTNLHRLAQLVPRTQDSTDSRALTE